MHKYIILHNAETGKELHVNAQTVKLGESVIIAGDWIECAPASLKELSSIPLNDKMKEIYNSTPIKWIDENGKELSARVIEKPSVINEMRENISDGIINSIIEGK